MYFVSWKGDPGRIISSFFVIVVLIFLCGGPSLGVEKRQIIKSEDILAKIDRAPALACQLLNPERVTGKDHVQLAVLNALRAFKNSRNISRQLSIEILLYASGQRQIEKALGMLGIKAGMQRVLAVAVGETDEEVKELLNAVRGLLGNQLYMLAAVLSHNLNRELQMEAKAPDRSTTEKRAPLWIFEELRSLRHRLIQRAGRFTNPQGNLTLTLSANESVKCGLLEYLEAFKTAA